MRNLLTKFIITYFLTILFPILVFAQDEGGGSEGADGVLINPALLYITGSQTNDNLLTSKTDTYINISAGYKFGGIWNVGLKYLSNTFAASSATVNTNTNISGYGINAGIILERLSFSIGYLFSSEKIQKVGGIEKHFFDGTAYVLDLAYRIQFGFFAIGPVLSYIVVDYKKTKDNTGESPLTTKYDDTMIVPYVGTWFFF